MEAETQRTAKPQTYTSEKIKVSPDKVGQISLMWLLGSQSYTFPKKYESPPKSVL